MGSLPIMRAGLRNLAFINNERMRILKIMLAPDLGCFETAYGQVEPSTGQSSRFTEWNRLSESIQSIAVRKDVDLALFPGDFFTTTRPLAAQVLAVTDLFETLEEMGVRVVGFRGNHDDLGATQPSPCSLLSKIGKALGYESWAVDGSDVVKMPSVNIAVLPYFKVPEANGNPKTIAAAVIEIARLLKEKCDPAVPCILSGHWSIEGAVASSLQVLGISEPVLPIGELLSLGYDAYLFGHIHRPQILHTKPFVGYAGALQRRDFGEEKDPRGCYIVEMETGNIEWVDLPAQEFLTLEYPDIEALRNVFSDAAQASGKIVRVKYRAGEGEIGAIDHGEIIKALEEAGATNVTGVLPEIIRSSRVRAEIGESTEPIDALNKWLDTKNLGERLRLAVVAEAEVLLEEIQTIEVGGAAA
jgi:exonuclease SbcD